MAKTASSSSQLALSVEKGGFQIPFHFEKLPYGRSVIQQLDNNSLFKEKPRQGLALVIDLTSAQPRQQIYNPDNWQLIDRKPENFLNPNYALVIFIVNGLFRSEELQQQLEELKKRLNSNGGEIFIFENSPQLTIEQLEQIEEERATIFAKSGFVKFKLLPQEKPKKNQPITGLLTQARLKKIGEHHRHGVDLLAPRKDDPPGKAEWRNNIIPNIVAQYERLGFDQVGTSVIEERLRHSTFPPRDLEKAKDGCGVEAKAACGCWIKVDLKGKLSVLNHCSDHESGIPNPQPEKKQSKQQYRLGETELSITCLGSHCSNANLIQTVVREKEYRNSMTSIIIEIKCPHCGVKSVKEDYVPTESLIKSKD